MRKARVIVVFVGSCVCVCVCILILFIYFIYVIMNNKVLDFERLYILLTKTFYNLKRYSLPKNDTAMSKS